MRNKDFTPTGDRVCFWPNDGSTRSQYDLRWANVFTVSDEARKWDDTTATHAIDSQYPGVFVYVWIDVTGRKETEVPGADERGTRIKIAFEKGTDDEVTATGWIVA